MTTIVTRVPDPQMVSDAGIVESITLKNFMCHSNLGPFAFGSNVNFVVGNNGSEGRRLSGLCVPQCSPCMRCTGALLLFPSRQVVKVPF